MAEIPARAATPANLTPDDIAATVEMLRACNQSVDAYKRYTDTQTQIITQQGALIDASKINSTAGPDSRLLWFGVGMLTTALTVYLVK